MEKTNCQKAHQEIIKLIQDFEDNFNHYTSPGYKEQEVREDFINKFWIALGWDVNHIHQKNPFQQEVKIEKGQRQNESNTQKRADYAFYLAPNYKKEVFFVEAKKPSKTLRQNKDDYFQTAKYGWNAGTGVSILTDFEEFVIIDCRFKPDFETILSNQIHYYDYKEFKEYECFEKIYWLFSHEAITAGNLQTFVENLSKPKGKGKQLKLNTGNYQSIDESFLNYIDNIRKEMAQALHENCPTLDNYELTEATQRTIDRLVFMRFLEDKLIEPENILYNIATHPKPWDKFIAESKRLDAKYNGVVFKPLFIDQSNFEGANQDLFRSICQDLDHTNTPYDFNYFPIHILGNIYERFLGKTIIIENGKANIDLKPEVRKAGGVFYTPKYIVDYIIENTLGKLIYPNGVTLAPSKVKEITLADIACGSGSFLIGAFEYLLDYHNIYYNNHPDEAQKDGCKYDPETAKWVLTIKQKQEILLNNIYGVDIDHQATEVTQLSLFLKMLEDETMSSANDMQVLFAQKILPDLSNNIKCGNSLIDYRIMDGMLEFGKEEIRRYNPFDFKVSFPKVFTKKTKPQKEDLKIVAKKAKEHAQKAMEYAIDLETKLSIINEPTASYGNLGGFDVIIGNPPYYRVTDKLMLDYFSKYFKFQNYQLDLYLLFLESYHELLKTNGLLGVIIPNTWLQSITFKNIRKYLSQNYSWKKILTSSKHIFEAVVDTHVLVFEKENDNDYNTIAIEKLIDKNVIPYQKLYQKDLPKNGEVINLMANPSETKLFEKIKSNSKPINQYAKIYNGVKPFEFDKGKPKQTKEILNNKPYVKENESKPEGENWLPLLRGSLMNKYINLWKNNSWINYGEWLAAPRDPKIFEAPDKIIIRQTADSIIATIIGKDIICRNNLHILISDSISHYFILAILNSQLIDFYYSFLNPEKGEVLAEVKKIHVEQLPLPILNKNNENIYNQLTELAKKMLKAKAEQQLQITEQDLVFYDNLINNLNHQINALVYEIYQLTAEEIAVVEG